jgi:pyruvate,orthophosphate dikinase
MVFGNRGADSATGVMFTRNPSTGEPTLFGDIMFGAQGEDVVAGGHDPQPLAALDERLPDVAAELRRHAELLEHHYADLCDVEFTVEEGRLWLLQVRIGKRSPRAALRMAIDMAEDESFPVSREEAVRRVARSLGDPPRVFVVAGERPAPLATGLPASPGVATGEIAMSPAAAEAAAAAGRPAILVRAETSPEDVPAMARSAGVLTTRGGLASHAAVVARGWGIPAVVGATDVHLAADAVEIGGRVLRTGEPITIDGSTGEIFAGDLAGTREIAPEAAVLMAWAAELGVGVGGGEAEGTRAAHADRDAGEAAAAETVEHEITVDDVTRALLVRGSVGLEQLGEALLAAPEDVGPLAARLVEAGMVEESDGVLRPSADGKLAALALMADDRRAVGEERTAEYLEAFHDLDGRMKEIVTSWQIRDVAGEQTLNDHGDATYDADVLDRLAGLHADASEWLNALAATLRRFAVYRSRLARAVNRARSGDERFVASPRVDSYHSVWFELHEDLIRLAGRRRSDEAEAGRA